jgi:hypothetical protein
VSFTGVTAPTAAAAAQPAQQYAPGFAPQPPFQAPQAPAQPAPQAAPASVAASVLGAPAGVDPNVWARLDPEQRQRVVAAMGTPVTAGQARLLTAPQPAAPGPLFGPGAAAARKEHRQ